VRSAVIGVSLATDQTTTLRGSGRAQSIRSIVTAPGARCRVFPLDGPIDRDFFPDHQAQLIGHAGHVLVVRVVGQPTKLALSSLAQPSSMRASSTE